MTTDTTLLHNTLARVEAAQTATEAVIRSHSKTFFFATALLPRSERIAIRSLYAFCRSSDDLVDCAQTTLQDMHQWREEVNRSVDEQTNPVLLSWAAVRQQYQIDRRYETELLDGIEMDLNFKPYQTWQDLEQYCYRVASTVGLLSIPVIGMADGHTMPQAAPYAIQLGIALQLTNILRDVGEDAGRGRVYFPLEDLRRFGLTYEDILHRVYDERFVALMRFEIARARALYQQSLPGIALLSRGARPAVGAAALLYRAILDQIERKAYNVYSSRAYTSGWQKIRMLPGIIWQVLTLKKPEFQ
ncbi:MAG: phytoene/squalene synthase family protein [Anaerolineae bacterium]|nr:phytoene/squalene synthase family protein [Anaerolineae bacterium]